MSLRRRRHASPVTVAVTPATPTKASGDTQAFAKTLTNVHGVTTTPPVVTGGVWSSSNPAVASINPTTGVATAILVGTTNINFRSASNAQDSTPAVLTVTAGAAALISITVQPGTADVGVPLDPQPVILVTDLAGNPVEGVTVVASLTAGTGVLSGDTSVDTDEDGLAAFTDLEIDAADDDFVLTFTAGALDVDSEVFEVTTP